MPDACTFVAQRSALRERRTVSKPVPMASLIAKVPRLHESMKVSMSVRLSYYVHTSTELTLSTMPSGGKKRCMWEIFAHTHIFASIGNVPTKTMSGKGMQISS